MPRATGHSAARLRSRTTPQPHQRLEAATLGRIEPVVEGPCRGQPPRIVARTPRSVRRHVIEVAGEPVARRGRIRATLRIGLLALTTIARRWRWRHHRVQERRQRGTLFGAQHQHERHVVGFARLHLRDLGRGWRAIAARLGGGRQGHPHRRRQHCGADQRHRPESRLHRHVPFGEPGASARNRLSAQPSNPEMIHRRLTADFTIEAPQHRQAERWIGSPLMSRWRDRGRCRPTVQSAVRDDCVCMSRPRRKIRSAPFADVVFRRISAALPPVDRCTTARRRDAAIRAITAF